MKSVARFVLTLICCSILFESVSTIITFAYNNGLAALPPMGWNTWCTDDICGLIDKCSDALVRKEAKALVDSGMADLGYIHVNMDDCWMAKQRSSINGSQLPDAHRFPYGMKALVDYVHSLGLKMGLYTCIGTETCRGGLPGSYNHYSIDAKQYAAWGIDFVKCDNCNRPGGFTEEQLYTNFSKELNATGRPILFSLCEWGDQDVQLWGAEVGQMYRIQMDHLPLWWLPIAKAAGKGIGQGTLQIIDYVGTLSNPTPQQFVKPHGWMDPDFLMTDFNVFGIESMTHQYSRNEISFWALWSAPLIVATHVHNMSQAKRAILMNKDVVAIDQDPLAVAGAIKARYFSSYFTFQGGKEVGHSSLTSNNTLHAQVWTKPLYNGDLAVLALHGELPDGPFKGTNATFSVSVAQLGFSSSSMNITAAKDLWTHAPAENGDHTYTGPAVSEMTFTLSPSTILFIRCTCNPAPCYNATLLQEQVGPYRGNVPLNFQNASWVDPL